jgi:DNA-binding transcriptional MerR regulator
LSFLISFQAVPYKETDIKKLYYTIGEVSDMFDVNTSLIRFWESEFDVLKPKKNNKGNRLFTPDDIEHLKVIYNLVKEQGLTLEGAKKYLKENKKQISHQVKNQRTQFGEIEEKLKKIKATLIDLRASLQ